MEFHWDPKPADPIDVNQHCCNRRCFLVTYGKSFGPFAEVIADDHYVLIAVLGYRERTCYVHRFAGNCLSWLHRLVSCSLVDPSFFVTSTTGEDHELLNLVDPSFFVTNTTGEDHGLFDSSITPSSSIFRTSFSASSCFAKGSLRGA